MPSLKPIGQLQLNDKSNYPPPPFFFGKEPIQSLYYIIYGLPELYFRLVQEENVDDLQKCIGKYIPIISIYNTK